MTTNSPTADFLERAIARSELTQREIAARAGFPYPNILSMMKQGDTKVPLDRIPALADACDVDATDFLRIAMAEYHPVIWEVLQDIFGMPLTGEEDELLTIFRLADIEGNLVIDEPLRAALVAVLTLASRAQAI